MAILKDGLQFTGSVGNLTAYTMKGSEKIVVRRKGGPSKEKIRKAPEFAKTREINTEFGLCAQVASGIRAALLPLNHMAGFNFTPMLTSMARHVQQLDTANEPGKRKVLFSQHKQLLEGFSLNQVNPFNSVIRHPLVYTIDREKLFATIQLPNLVPDMSISLPWKEPVYRFVAALGFMNDEGPTAQGHAIFAATEWHPAYLPFGGKTLELNFTDKSPLESELTMILSIGIEMGTPVSDTYVKLVKNHAAAKILAAS